MKITGTKIEPVSVDVSLETLFKTIKQELLGIKNVDEVVILEGNDSKLAIPRHKHGAVTYHEIVTDERDKVATFKALVYAEKTMKQLK